MDELGPLNIEFLINNPEVIAQAKQVEATLQGVNDAVQQSAVNSTNAILVNLKRVEAELLAERAKLSANRDPYNVGAITANINRLQASLTTLQRQHETAVTSLLPDPKVITEATEKTGKFQAAIERSTNVQNIGARVVTMFTRQIIGLGVGFLSLEIGAKAIKSLIEYISHLDFFTGRLDQAKQNLIAFNEVMGAADKDAGKQIGSLETLYDAATNVNNSIKDRIAAAQQLREAYPEEFANASALAIINGQLKKSYDDLTLSIIAQAKSHAATAKIEDLSGKILDEQFIIDKNNLDKAKKIAAVRGEATDIIIGAGGTSGTAGSEGITLTEADQKQRIIDQTNKSNLAHSQNIKIAQETIGYLEGFVIDVSKKAVELRKANQLLGDNLQNFDNLISKTTDKTDLDNIKKALQAKLDALAPGDSQIAAYADKIRQVEELEKKYAPKLGDNNAAEQALKRRLALLDEITKATQAANRKGLDSDQAALQAITDKFTDLKKKIAEFNADPKNKNVKIGSEIIDTVNTAENSEYTDQNTENQTKNLQAEIERNKKLYADYEAYRKKVGKDAADEEYADLLKSGKDFQTYLGNISNYVDQSDDSGPMKARSAMILKYQHEDAENQQKELNALLESVKTYQTQRTELTATYEDKRQQLIAAKKYEEVSQLDQQYKEQLSRLDDANFQQLTSVKELFSGITQLSAAAAKKLIADVQAELNMRIAAGTISVAEAKKTQDAIEKATSSLGDRLPKELNEAVAGLDEMAKAADLFNTSLGDSINLLSSIVSNVSKGIAAYNALKKAAASNNGKGDLLAEISASIPLIGAAIAVVGAVVKFFKAAHDSAVQAKAEMQAYQYSLINGQVKYNELLREQARTQGDITKMTIAELQAKEQLLATQKQQAQADYNTLLREIQNAGQQITGEHKEKYGGFLGIGRKTKVVQDLAGLNSADYDTLQKLYAEGKLNDTTKQWFEQLQQVKQELDDIGTSAQDALNQLNQDATGTTANAIASAIIDGFKQGKRTAADFADDFRSLMQNAALSVFENDYLTTKINDFYQKFATASEAPGGLTPEAIAQLQQEYAGIINDAGTQIGQLEKVVGPINGGSSASSPNSLTGAIKGMTEDQANLLAGQFGGLRLTQLETNSILVETSANGLQEMRAQTMYQMRTAIATESAADSLIDVKGSLKNIDKNTSSDALTGVLRAAGKN